MMCLKLRGLTAIGCRWVHCRRDVADRAAKYDSRSIHGS